MDWYRVVKTIKKRRYVYLQKTWREGKSVRCRSRYMGPFSISAVGYHGTFAKFQKFSSDFLGSNTGATDAVEGFFFASNRNVAISYASTELAAKRGLDVTIRTIEHRIRAASGMDHWDALKALDAGAFDNDPGLRNKLRAYEVRLEKADRRLAQLCVQGVFKEIRPSKRGEVREQRLVMRRAYYYDMEGTRYRPWTYKSAIRCARAGGYDGVVIKNTYDGGTPSHWNDKRKADLTDVYIVFDAGQILDVERP